MKVKRLLSAALILLTFCTTASAQKRLDIVLKDKTMTSVSLDDINYMEIVEQAGENEIDGVWYLGWKVNSSGTQNSGGSEMLVFTAGRMRWVKPTTEAVYSVTYNEAGPVPGTTLTAVKETGTTYKYTIFANDGEVLVLKQGSTARYYFYKS
ncbi:MAG: hypothetical protein IKQ07_09750, partial [Bacteroidaceae bacterium]|nr:hypothetical protein [Bacteroidaceae bacterium]